MGALTDIYLRELVDIKGFRAWARSHIDAHGGNSGAMQQLAVTLLSISDMSGRCPDLALESARAAYDATGQHHAHAIAVYARALYQVGAMDRAIAVQQDAVALATPQAKNHLQDIVDFYRTCKRVQVSLN